MDVTFTNVLEGARQYFQGLPTASSSQVGPAYTNSSENLQRNNGGPGQSSELPPSSTSYWVQQQQHQEHPRLSVQEQTSTQRPSSHHSDGARPPSHSQLGSNAHHEQGRPLNHYSGSYQDHNQTQQAPQAYQFSRPHSGEATASMPQHQYQSQFVQNSPYHQSQSPQQQSRTPNCHDQVIATSVNSSESYHQSQSAAQSSQGYSNYQQARACYPIHSQSQSQQATSNNSYKVASSQPTSQSSQENPYYKHLYTPHPQSSSQVAVQYMNSKPALPHAQQDNKRHEQESTYQNQITSQAYRTTHSLPPIAALSSVNYHSSRNNRESGGMTANKLKTVTPNPLSVNSMNDSGNNSASNVHQNSVRIAAPYSVDDMQQQNSRQNLQYVNSQTNRFHTNQNYQYSTTTATTQSFTQVIMTTSNSVNAYNMQEQSSSRNQNYSQLNTIITQSNTPTNMVPQQVTTSVVQPSMSQSVNGRVASMIKQKRESPLDLSVKTVRTSADSTLDDAVQDARSKYFPNTRTSNSSVPVHNYPTCDITSFQRNFTGRPSQMPSATAPKVEFHPNFNVPSLNNSHLANYRKSTIPNPAATATAADKMNNQRFPVDKGNYQMNQMSFNTNRYPTITMPTSHVNSSYIQTTSHAAKKSVESLPRVDFPNLNHIQKDAAASHYSASPHDIHKKRAAETIPSPIIPTKINKIDTWRQNIDQQIEQKFSSYQQQKQISAPKNCLVNGNYPASNQDRSKEAFSGHQRQNYSIPQAQTYPNINQYSHAPNSHSQTYVPSAVVHPFPGYGSYSGQSQNIYAQNSRTSNYPSASINSSNNKNNLGGANKKVISLLRNSLEIKGAKEAQKRLEQKQMNRQYDSFHKQSRSDVQHPSTDVTAPLQPKPGITNRQNVSPFTPTNFPEGNNNLSSMYKFHIPKAIDSVNFGPEGNKLLNPSIDKQLDDSQTFIGNHFHPEFDGLAAYLAAARIRTKGELKQVGPAQETGHLQQLQALNDHRTPLKQENFQNALGGTSSSLSPPKLAKERHSFPPRRRLFIRNEDDSNSASNVPPRDKSGLRSSSETSVFDFPDSDSETEMPVLERQTLEDMRRDRKTSSKGAMPSTESRSESSRPPSPDDDIFTQACDSFMEQLKSGSGKKRGRRKKFEADVLAKLETVTKEKPLETDIVIKKEFEKDDDFRVDAMETDNKDDIEDGEDSDVPLIISNDNIKIEGESEIPSKSLNTDAIKSEVEEISLIISDKTTENGKKEPVDNSLAPKQIPPVTRPAKKPNFGDGSHFGPGWEEEVYKYKKSLRMPPSLIQVTRPPQYHRLSTSLPDLDPCPHSPTPSSLADAAEYSKMKLPKVKSENLDSDSESNCSFNLFSNKNYDSEGGSSIKSLPYTSRENNSILDRLLEKYGGRRKRRTKKKDDTSPKTLPKPDKIVELLPTPNINENTTGVVTKSVSNASLLGFRKKTVNNFKEVFINNVKDVHTRTRKQTRLLKQRATIKEVFGEDRPASAPPVTCVNHIKIKEEPDDDNNLTIVMKKDPSQPDLHTVNSGLTDTKQALKNKLLNRGKAENNLLKVLVDRKIKSEFLYDQNLDDSQDDYEMNDIIKRDPDSKSGTPSIDGDDGSVLGKKQRNKFRSIRRKLSSGFDYIRKKKKQAKKDSQENEAAVKPKKRIQTLKTSPSSVQDIQKEIKGWVLNKGIGETHLHRSARLGYTDVTVYCLEKMQCAPTPKDNAGYTPLHEASARGHLDIAKMLLLYGANVSESARGGIRPLHEASENGYVEIVRLLLSYGADPLLATYSGMTPIALASDDSTIKLLQGHINDSQGRPTSPWKFAGPASYYDAKEYGYNIVDDVPEPDPPISEDEDLEFEVSDNLLPNLYTLNGESYHDRWMLLQDLSNLLKIKSRDALLRQICPSSTSTAQVNYKSFIRELKMSDFLEQAHCCQFLNIGEKINTRASKIALVKYTDKVRELLSVEKVKISVR